MERRVPAYRVRGWVAPWGQPRWAAGSRFLRTIHLEPPCDPAIPRFGLYPPKNMFSESHSLTHSVPRSTLPNSQDMAMNSKSTARGMDEEEVFPIHSGILLSPKREPPPPPKPLAAKERELKTLTQSQTGPEQKDTSLAYLSDQSVVYQRAPMWLSPPRECMDWKPGCWLPYLRGRVWEGLGLVG